MSRFAPSARGFLALALLLAPGQAFQRGGVEPPAAPSPERIALAVERLEAAWKGDDLEDLLDTLREESSIVADRVVDLVAKGLRDRRLEVRDAALGALGIMPHPDARQELLAFAKRHRRTIEDDVALHERVVRAIGLHADARDIGYFASNIFKRAYDPKRKDERKVVRARIYALGRIRTRESIEALFDIMRSSDPKRTQRHMRDLRVSLMLLTGKDLGHDMPRWMEWWSDNKRGFEIAEAEPQLPDEELRAWQSFWGFEQRYSRGERRGERGSDD